MDESATIDISRLLASALEDVDNPTIPVSTLARKALRVARLRNDWEAQLWLGLEMLSIDHAKPESAQIERVVADIRPHLTKEEYEAIGERVFPAWMKGPRTVEDGKFLPTGIADTETRVDAIEAQISALKVPDGMHPVDLYFRSKENTGYTVMLNTSLGEARAVLARQRDRIGDYLSRVETETHFGRIHSDVFERNRLYVEERLRVLAPQVLEQFQAAYDRHAEGDVEARSQALVSCRRVLKTLADSLYPATGEEVEGIDGARRAMTDDKYVVRLCQYAAESSAGSASRDIIVDEVKALGKRLSDLISLTSKGVHHEVSESEVDQSLMQTYTVVGDLLRIADDRSATLA